MYSIRFSNQAKKYIESLDTKRKKQIQNAIDSLRIDPFSYPYKKLHDFEADFRIRVGNLRISYCVDKKEVLISIIKVGKRENFYS